MRLVSCAVDGDWVKAVIEVDGKQATQRLLRSKDADTAAYRAACAISVVRERLTGMRWVHDSDLEEGRKLMEAVCA